MTDSNQTDLADRRHYFPARCRMRLHAAVQRWDGREETRPMSRQDYANLMVFNYTEAYVNHLISRYEQPWMESDKEKLTPFGLSVIRSARNKRESSKQCMLCHAAYIKDEWLIDLACDHMLHNECAVEWFVSHCKCPICGEDYRPKDISPWDDAATFADDEKKLDEGYGVYQTMTDTGTFTTEVRVPLSKILSFPRDQTFS